MTILINYKHCLKGTNMAKTEAEMTEQEIVEMKADRSTKSKASRAKRLAAIDILVKFIEKNHTNRPAEIQASINRLTGNARSGGGGGDLKRVMILELIQKNRGKMSEVDLFTTQKLGRMEMRAICNDLIKKVKDPSERVWVAFDPENGIYSIAGKGENPPKNWTGYVPVVVETIDEDEDEE